MPLFHIGGGGCLNNGRYQKTLYFCLFVIHSPLPPRENGLSVPIQAGEKDFKLGGLRAHGRVLSSKPQGLIATGR